MRFWITILQNLIFSFLVSSIKHRNTISEKEENIVWKCERNPYCSFLNARFSCLRLSFFIVSHFDFWVSYFKWICSDFWLSMSSIDSNTVLLYWFWDTITHCAIFYNSHLICSPPGKSLKVEYVSWVLRLFAFIHNKSFCFLFDKQE